MPVSTVERKKRELGKKQQRISNDEIGTISKEEQALRELRGLFIEEYNLIRSHNSAWDIIENERRIIEGMKNDAKRVFKLAKKSASIFKKEELDAIIIARKSILLDSGDSYDNREISELIKAQKAETAIEKVTILILRGLKKLSELHSSRNTHRQYSKEERLIESLKSSAEILNNIYQLIMREEDYERYAINVGRGLS